MNDIIRYGWSCEGMCPVVNGGYVDYEDHIEAITSLLAEIHTAITRAASQPFVDTMPRTCCMLDNNNGGTP